MSHIWMSPVPHMNESCHAYSQPIPHISWVMCPRYKKVSSHIWMSHVLPMNGSHHAYCHGAFTNNESCPMYDWISSHIWMGHVPHLHESHLTMKQSCSPHDWVTSRIQSTASSPAPLDLKLDFWVGVGSGEFAKTSCRGPYLDVQVGCVFAEKILCTGGKDPPEGAQSICKKSHVHLREELSNLVPRSHLHPAPCANCKSDDTRESVMSYIWMSRVNHVNESCQRREGEGRVWTLP